MHRLTELVHYIIRNVRDVIDRAFANGFEPLYQNVRRRTDLHTLNNSRGKSMAKIGIFDLYYIEGKNSRHWHFGR